jgi:hypothetical protein
MKKVNIVLLILALAVGVGFAGPVQAAETDITLWDYVNHSGVTSTAQTGQVITGVAPGNPAYSLTQAPNEDQTLTKTSVIGQHWDMEATVKQGNDLVLIGGWNWKTGYDGNVTGNIFLTNDLANTPFGRNTAAPAGSTTTNATYGYNYAVRLDFNNSKFYIMTLSGTTGLNQVTNYTYDDQKYASPLSVQSFTEDPGSGNFGTLTLDENKTASYIGTQYNNVVTVTGSPDSHNIATLKNFFLKDIFSPTNETEFIGSITMSCGNDSMVFGGTNPATGVPLPGALLLLGAGLTRLAAYARKRAQ